MMAEAEEVPGGRFMGRDIPDGGRTCAHTVIAGYANDKEQRAINSLSFTPLIFHAILAAAARTGWNLSSSE